MKTIKPGTVVIFDPANFNQTYWSELPEEDRRRFYGALGYGQEKKKLFVFLCEIVSAPGHCILVSLDDQHIETMRHTNDFRPATDDEF